MKKIWKYVFFIIMLMLSVGVFISCSFKKIGNPVFAKSLVCTEDWDFDLNYVCDKSWEKTVKKVKIIGFPSDTTCSVYNDDRTEVGDYASSLVECGFSSDTLEESDTSLVKTVSFNSVEITWSDGTKTTEDIGNIIVLGNDFESIDDYIQMEEKDSDYNSSVFEYSKIREADYKIANVENFGMFGKEELEKFNLKNELADVYERISVNGISFEKLFNGKTFKVKKDKLFIESEIKDYADRKYDEVSVFLPIQCNLKKGKKKQYVIMFDEHFNQGSLIDKVL